LYFLRRLSPLCSFFFMAPAPTAIYPLSLHDALPISLLGWGCAVKWSGAYWVAGFALLVLLFDLGARRAAGVRRPWAGTVRRDLGPAVWALGVVPVLAYLSAWWGWFRSETGTDRYAVGIEVGTGGAFSFLPDALRSLWYYSGQVLEVHAGPTTEASGVHPWE